jgi:hypothetical protein
MQVLAGGLALAVAAGCGRGGDNEAAVATPAAVLSQTQAPLGSPLEITYRFTVAADAPALGEDHRVFVHFLDSNEELMWTDDHTPPVPTTNWKPGQVVEYTRTVFVPIYPYVGETTIRVGLYSPKTNLRLPLAGDNSGQRAYKVATLTLLPQSENVFLIYKDGWHPAEVARDNAAVEWQWTTHKATLSFRNPRRDATLYLHLDGRPDLVGGRQRVGVALGGQPLETIELTGLDEVIRKIPVTAAQFGGAEIVDLTLTVDPAFVPAQVPAAASADARELGVRVFHTFIAPR